MRKGARDEPTNAPMADSAMTILVSPSYPARNMKPTRTDRGRKNTTMRRRFDDRTIAGDLAPLGDFDRDERVVDAEGRQHAVTIDHTEPALRTRGVHRAEGSSVCSDSITVASTHVNACDPRRVMASEPPNAGEALGSAGAPMPGTIVGSADWFAGGTTWSAQRAGRAASGGQESRVSDRSSAPPGFGLVHRRILGTVATTVSPLPGGQQASARLGRGAR